MAKRIICSVIVGWKGLAFNPQQRSFLVTLTAGGVCTSSTPCISGTDWNLCMWLTPIDRKSQANSFWCLEYQKMSRHVHKNQNGGRQIWICEWDVVIRTWYHQSYKNCLLVIKTPILEVQQRGYSLMSGVTGKSNMTAINRKWTYAVSCISAYV